MIPDNFKYTFPNFHIKDIKYPIPYLSGLFTILGIEINIGVFFGMSFDLIDISFSIPVGFDYFKGYKLT